jgi:hypothetical protein
VSGEQHLNLTDEDIEAVRNWIREGIKVMRAWWNGLPPHLRVELAAEAARQQGERVARFCGELGPQTYLCTKPVDHDGHHRAVVYGRIVSSWPQEEEPKCEGRTPWDCGNPSCPVHGEEQRVAALDEEAERGR